MTHDNHAVQVKRAMVARKKAKNINSTHNFATRVSFGTYVSVLINLAARWSHCTTENTMVKSESL